MITRTMLELSFETTESVNELAEMKMIKHFLKINPRHFLFNKTKVVIEKVAQKIDSMFQQQIYFPVAVIKSY